MPTCGAVRSIRTGAIVACERLPATSSARHARLWLPSPETRIELVALGTPPSSAQVVPTTPEVASDADTPTTCAWRIQPSGAATATAGATVSTLYDWLPRAAL